MSNAFAQALLGINNTTNTTNGDVAFKSTRSSVLDFYSRGAAMRDAFKADKGVKVKVKKSGKTVYKAKPSYSEAHKELIPLFEKALQEDPTLAMKALFHFRDAREGQGVRDGFRAILQALATSHPELVRKNLTLVSEYGRWDDLWALFKSPLEDDVLNIVKIQLTKDMTTAEGKSISNCAKWCPSENASSDESKAQAYKLMKKLGLNPRSYRKMLTKLRARLNIVETPMSKGLFGSIEYAKVPSRANLIYRNAFKKNDCERYTKFISKVNKGEVKMHSAGLYPHEIISKVRAGDHSPSLDAMWKSLPNMIPEGESILAICDTSGSMTSPRLNPNTHCVPLDVSLAMGLYVAEHQTGAFKNMFITFSDSPILHEISGNTLSQKISSFRTINVMGTNIVKAFDLILSTAIRNSIPQKDMITSVVLFSDMQFNNADKYGYRTAYHTIKDKFERHGYIMPRLAFWNLNASANSPVTKDENGTVLVAGYSANTFNSIFKGNNPYESMLETLNSERYSAITI